MSKFGEQYRPEDEASSQPPPGYYQPAGDPVMSQPGMAPPPGMASPGAYPMPQMGHTSYTTNTTIINQQPPMNLGPRNWSSGVMDCCDDMGICCFGYFCGCCQAMEIATDMGESSCVPCCVPGWLIVLRAKFRAHHNIHGSVMDDCCTICFCGACVMCQMAREIKMMRATSRLIVPNQVV